RPAELQHCGHNGSVTSRQSTGQQAVPLAEMLREGGQTDSSTARRLFHCCRLSTVALSQTGIYADRLVLEECNGYCGYQETGATVTTSRVTTGGGTRKKLQADCLLTTGRSDTDANLTGNSCKQGRTPNAHSYNPQFKDEGLNSPVLRKTNVTEKNLEDFDVLKEDQEHSSISAAPVISYLLSNRHTELSRHSAFTKKLHKPRYQGAKVKPCDWNVIAQQVHLPVLLRYSAFTGKWPPLRMTLDFPTETLSIQCLHVNISKLVMN
ncbi:hypothetical protein KUCAC02_024969, partial [Chaenocephalus aceratus]